MVCSDVRWMSCPTTNPALSAIYIYCLYTNLSSPFSTSCSWWLIWIIEQSWKAFISYIKSNYFTMFLFPLVPHILPNQFFSLCRKSFVAAFPSLLQRLVIPVCSSYLTRSDHLHHLVTPPCFLLHSTSRCFESQHTRSHVAPSYSINDRRYFGNVIFNFPLNPLPKFLTKWFWLTVGITLT